MGMPQDGVEYYVTRTQKSQTFLHCSFSVLLITNS